MGLSKIAGKLDEYFERLDQGKAAQIKPTHVEKAIAKLLAKQSLLEAELGDAQKPSKKDRLEGKLVTVREQIKRAEWLLDNIKD